MSKVINMVRDKNGEYHLPTAMDLCPICGEPSGVVAGGGKKIDKIGHSGAVISNSPCAGCMNNMKIGIMIIEVRDDTQVSPIRTGRIVIITQKCAESFFQGIDFNKTRCCYMEESMFSQLFNQVLEEKQNADQQEKPE